MQTRSRWARPARAAVVGASLAAAFLVAACGRPAPKTTADVEAGRVTRLPAEPNDPAWQQAPVCAVALLPQDIVEPRLMAASTAQVSVRALSDGARVAFLLSWADSTRNDLPGAARFSDACAVQLPRAVTADLPAPQMGELGRTVEIVYWSSAWQARVDGRKDDITELYPRAAVGHYPFNAQSLVPDSPEQKAMALRYSPARSRGNWMAGDGVHAVQDLLAEGPGTLTPVEGGTSTGKGRRTATGWEVVLVRNLPVPAPADGRTQVAFAVWDGSHQEVGARKMRSGWTPLVLGGRP